MMKGLLFLIAVGGAVWAWLKWRSPQAELEELHRRAAELERQRRLPSVGPSVSARLRDLVRDYRTWAERHPGRAAPRRIEKSVMDRGGRINLPGLENPNADSWVEVPRGGGCPWLLEGPEMQCVLAHETETTCEYFCTPIHGGPSDPDEVITP